MSEHFFPWWVLMAWLPFLGIIIGFVIASFRMDPAEKARLRKRDRWTDDV